MKIVIICQWFPPEYAPIGVMLSELAQDLAGKGHQVTVITGFPNHPGGVVFDGYRKTLASEEYLGAVRIVRCYLYTSPKKTFLRRILNYGSFAVSALWAALRLERQDLLYMVSPPLTNGVLALLLSMLKKLPYVFNVQDIYPDAAVSAGVIRNPLLVRGLKLLEREIYRRALAVTVISEGFRDNLAAKGVPQTKIRVLENWLDAAEVIPLPRDNPFAVEHRLGGKFVVLYSGTIGLVSGAEILLECAERLKGHRDLVFLFVGEGVVKDSLVCRAERMGLQNVRFLPFQPRAVLSQVQSSADVSVVTLLKGKGGSSVPSKVLGYMAAARPVIASVDRDSDTGRLIERAGCGLCVDAGDAAALAGAIEELYRDRGRGAALGERGRRYLLSHCDRKTVIERYESLFLQCCQGGVP